MKTDFSRQRFDPARDFSGVLMQQGRVQLDADWNEQAEILDHRLRAGTLDTAGRAVVPRDTGPDGFRIERTVDGRILIHPGRAYVEGLLAENHGFQGESGTGFDPKLAERRSAQPVPYEQQPYLKNAAVVSPLPTGNERYFLYLDVWSREVTSLSDPSLIEPAIGVDTTTRLQTVWQVKVLPNVGPNVTPDSPDEAIPGWVKLALPSSGRLTTEAAPAGAAPAAGDEETDPDALCRLPPVTGYSGHENCCFRVEIHSVDPDSRGTTFKWSRDNRSMCSRVTAIPDRHTLIVDTVALDPVLAFNDHDWIEVTDDLHELAGLPGELVMIRHADPNAKTITLETDLSAGVFAPDADGKDGAARHTRVRKWDQNGTVVDVAGKTQIDLTNPQSGGAIPVALGTKIRLADNVVVEFSLATKDGRFHVGDYWVFAARTSDRSVEELRQAPPRGPHHHYARLALMIPGRPPADCRRVVPSLATITGDDVAFDHARTGELPNADTVQEAIDELSRRYRGCCTVVAGPGDNLQAAFDRIPAGQDALVCLRPGTYPVTAPVLIGNKGCLTVKGAGFGTRLVAPKHESVLLFSGCRQVRVSGLAVEAGATLPGLAGRHLNGALGCTDCDAVEIESIRIRCAHGSSRRAACLNVSDLRSDRAAAARTDVRIRHCDLLIGHQQVGLLLVNCSRASVEDNRLRSWERPAGNVYRMVEHDRAFRARLRAQLLTGLQVGAAAATAPAGSVTVTRGRFAVRFTTTAELASAWPAVLDAAIPAATPVKDGRALQARVYAVADQLLLKAGRVANTTAFAEPVRRLLRAAAGGTGCATQGIVVAGATADDVRILHNSVTDAQQAVHVGVSHRADARGVPDTAGTLQIVGNVLHVRIPPGRVRSRHGVFVGNCISLLVENNHLTAERPSASYALDGIRIHGYLGCQMLVRQNCLSNVLVGVRVVPLKPRSKAEAASARQWIVAWNIAPHSKPPVVAPATVRQIENLA